MDAYHWFDPGGSFRVMFQEHAGTGYREFANATNERTARAIVAYLLAGNVLRARALAREDHEAYEARALGVVA